MGITQPVGPNGYAAFAIHALLPDFAPRTVENSTKFDQPGWHDQLHALFQYGKVPRPKEELLRFYLGISKTSEFDFKVVGGRYRLYESASTVPHEIYTTDTPNGLLLFSCDRQSDFRVPIFPYCSATQDFGNRVGVTYSFGRDHRLEAADIDARLRALLSSFVEH